MKAAEIKQAKVGDRVKFEPRVHDAGEYCEGTITAVGRDEVTITWDDDHDVTVMYPMQFTRVSLK